MDVGVAIAMQNPHRQQADHQVYWEERRLADLTEPLGFDSFWTVEHHFDDYTMVPDVCQFLTYMAGRTSCIKLGTAVIVLPWHDPVRVAEENMRRFATTVMPALQRDEFTRNGRATSIAAAD
jgi:alkanesulfonate monooxygenase SsuD/methylene tetrahydromethanopterin reductase-like flavin-dependent oxidoreductase (luciferase family)